MTPLKRYFVAFALTAIAFGRAATGVAQDKSTDPEIAAQQRRAQIQKILTDTVIDTKDLRGEMPLAKFLVALEAKMPEGNKISLRIDEEAFGKWRSELASASVMCPLQEKVSVATVLRRVLSQVSKVAEVDYAFRPAGVVLTQPRLAAHEVVYDVRALEQQMPLLLPELESQSPGLYKGVKATDGPALLVRFLMNGIAMQPWETVQLSNGGRLAVFASPLRHEEFVDLMDALRQISDTAVVMNARLYEVDRQFFTKHVAPLFSRDDDSEERRVVIPIDGSLFKTIARQKQLLASEDNKIRPHQEARFLSRQSVYRYAAGPHPTEKGQTMTGTGMAGVTFTVRPLVSADRRHMRLEIAQEAAQLVGIDKIMALDGASGKETEIESPNVRTSSASGAVQIADGFPILMPVNYRPPGEGNKDKVWLLMARPFIWIGEEVKEIRQGGGDLSPQSVWDSEIPKKEKPAAAKPLPSTHQVKDILQAVITDVLTNPNLKNERQFYGTATDKTVALVDQEKLGWPKGFRPDTHGYKLVEAPEDPFANPRRVLGIRLDKFDLKQRKSDLFDTPITVCLFNAGGTANGAVTNGCFVYYLPNRVGKRWTVEYAGALAR